MSYLHVVVLAHKQLMKVAEAVLLADDDEDGDGGGQKRSLRFVGHTQHTRSLTT